MQICKNRTAFSRHDIHISDPQTVNYDAINLAARQKTAKENKKKKQKKKVGHGRKWLSIGEVMHVPYFSFYP